MSFIDDLNVEKSRKVTRYTEVLQDHNFENLFAERFIEFIKREIQRSYDTHKIIGSLYNSREFGWYISAMPSETDKKFESHLGWHGHSIQFFAANNTIAAALTYLDHPYTLDCRYLENQLHQQLSVLGLTKTIVKLYFANRRITNPDNRWGNKWFKPKYLTTDEIIYTLFVDLEW